MSLKCFVLGIVFLIIGILFFSGKAIPNMKWWDELSPKERESIRVCELGRNVGSFIFLAGIIFEMAAIFPIFKDKYFTLSMIVWLIITGIDVYYIEKSKRYFIHNNSNKKLGGAL